MATLGLEREVPPRIDGLLERVRAMQLDCQPGDASAASAPTRLMVAVSVSWGASVRGRR